MSDQDRENIFQLARLVKKMHLNLHSDTKGKQRLLYHLIDVAHEYCDPVLNMLGYVELKDDSPMKCKQCRWTGKWVDAMRKPDGIVCPLCQSEIVMEAHT